MTMLEKRWAMPDPRRLGSTLVIRSSLVLLALVLVAPIRLSGFVTVSSRPDCFRSDFTLSPGEPTTSLSAAMRDIVRKMKALRCGNEEEEGADALDEPRVSFLSLCSFRKVPDHQATAPRSILSLYPLLC
jgi:hypothetical protein